jgi:dCMP deaminase
MAQPASKLTKLPWDDYFMVSALWASSRSTDTSTQHGAFIVDEDNIPVAQGYNGFPRGCDDSAMPQCRPDKYKVVIHAERNAILNANGCLRNCTLYVTGYPCVDCWCTIIQSGITRVVYGPVRSTSPDSPHLDDNNDNKLVDLLLSNRKMEIVEWKPQKLETLMQRMSRLFQLVGNLAGE